MSFNPNIAQNIQAELGRVSKSIEVVKAMTETLKLLSQMPEPLLTEYIFDKVVQIGAIRTTEMRFNSP
jgi:hypothetical protein